MTHKYDIGETLAHINEYNCFLGYKTITGTDFINDEPLYFVNPTDVSWYPINEDDLHKYHAGYFSGVITESVLDFVSKYDADWLIEVIAHKIRLPLYNDKVLTIGKINIISFNNDVVVNIVTRTGELVSLEAFYNKTLPDGNWTLYYDNNLIYF